MKWSDLKVAFGSGTGNWHDTWGSWQDIWVGVAVVIGIGWVMDAAAAVISSFLSQPEWLDEIFWVLFVMVCAAGAFFTRNVDVR